MASRTSRDGTSERMAARVAKAFKHWDEDGNGRVSREELIKVLAHLGSFEEKDVDTIMLAVDSDHSGTLDYSEFISWCFSGDAPYTIVRGFLKGGLCCLEGHPLEEFQPAVDGWCCEECGKDLDIGIHALQCSGCDGISWCVPCAARLNDAGEDLRAERERAVEEEAVHDAWEADEAVRETAERREWPSLVRKRMMRWPPPTRENLEDLLAGGIGGVNANLAFEATQRWLDKSFPLEEFTATVELRRFLRDHDLEGLLPYMESGSIKHVEDLAPGAGLDELAQKLPESAMQHLYAAGDAVADARTTQLAESLGWEELVRDFTTQVSGLSRDELAEMLFSTAGLTGDVDASTYDAVHRWLDHLLDDIAADDGRRRRGSVGLRHLSPGPSPRPAAASAPASHPSSPKSGRATGKTRTVPPQAQAPTGRKTTTLSIELPDGARPGEIVRVPHAGLLLPVRVPYRAKPGAPLQVVVPAAAAARMIGVGFNVGDLVEVDLPGTDVHGLVGRVVEFRVEQSRVAVDVAGRVLGFAASSLHTAAHIQPPGLSRFTTAPAAVHFGPAPVVGRPVAVAAPDADGPAVLMEALEARAPAAPPPPELERSTSLAEACMGERFGAYPPHDLELGPGTCSICMEDKEVFKVCETDDCAARICKDCAGQYARTMVEGAYYSMPFLKCPGCRARVQTPIWQPLVEDAMWQKYTKVGAALTEFRCGSCHQSRTMWEPFNPKLKEAGVFRGVSARSMDVVRATWQQFSRAQLEPPVLWAELFKAFCGSAGDDAKLPPTIPESLNLKEVLGLIMDDERRLALHLAAVRRHPRIITYCCGAKMCFGCKITWHDGKTCEDVRRAEKSKDVQFCPNCGVATVKSEGCNHMVCVCGTHWTWGANPKVRLLCQAISRRNYAEIKNIAPDESTAIEALQSSAWDNVDIAPALPALLDSPSGDLLSPGFLQEVWRITVGMGRSNAPLALQHILERWPRGNDCSALWGVALLGRRATAGSSLLDLPDVLQTLMRHERGGTAFLSALWSEFVTKGHKVITQKVLEVPQVLDIILRGAENPNDPDLFANILNASSGGTDQISIIIVLQVLLARVKINAKFIADVWRSVLGGTGVGIHSLSLESYQIDEAFQLIMKHCSEDAELLASMLGPASAKGHVISMKALLERRVDVNTSAGSSCPALVTAAGAGQPEAVQLLLEFRADPDAGESPAMHEVLNQAMRLESVFDSYSRRCSEEAVPGRPGPEQIITVKFKEESRSDSIGPSREFSWFPRPKRFTLAVRGGGGGGGGAAAGGGGGGGRRSPSPARAAPRRAGAAMPPAGAYRIGSVPEHPTAVASTRKKGKATRAGVLPGDVLVEISNERGVQRRETDLARGDAERLIGRVQLPVTLVFKRGLKSQLAAVERDWQARTAVVGLLCSARADILERPVDVVDRAGLDHGRISPLLLAARAGLTAAASSLLQRGAVPGSGEEDEAAIAAGARELVRALGIACRGGHRSMVDLLLEKRASPTLGVPGPMLDVAQGLRTDGSLWDPELFDRTQEERLAKCPLVEIDWQDRVAIVRRLCAVRADANTGSSGAASALHYAAEAGCIEAAQLLVRQGGILRGPKLTALQRGATGVRTDLVELLLAARAPPDGPTGAEDVPLASPLAAAAGGAPPAKQETVDERRRRRLQWSARLAIAKQLLDARADVERSAVRTPTLAEASEAVAHKKPGGATPTPLKAACVTGHAEIVELLLARGASASAMGSTALLDCVGQAHLRPRDFEADEEEVAYEEPAPPRWWNQIQRNNWEVAQWRKFRNDRVRRRERRQKRLRLEGAVYEADTAARIAIIRQLVAQRADPGCAEGGPLAEAARRGSDRLVSLLLTLGAPVDPRLQWCPSCWKPALLSKPPDAAAAAEAEEVYASGKKSSSIVACSCGASWPLAASPLHSLVAAGQDELLWLCISREGADMDVIRELWAFAGTMLSKCGDRARPARAPEWGGRGCAKLLVTLMERKAAIDSLLPTGGTLLRIACATGQYEAVQALLERRANPDSVAAARLLTDAEKERGEMPLQAAVLRLRLAPGSTSDPALQVAAACGGLSKLPEDIERLLVCEEEKPPDISWAVAGGAAVGRRSVRSGSASPSPRPAARRPSSNSSSPRPAARRVGASGHGDGGVKVKGFPVIELTADGPAARAGISKGDLLVDARGVLEMPGAHARDFLDAGTAEKALLRHAPPLVLKFRGPACTYTYEESPLKALVLTTTEHDMLRVTGLLVTPGRDTPEGGDACPKRCKAIMGRIIARIDSDDVLAVSSTDVLKRLEQKGLTLHFLSSAGEARAIRAFHGKRQLAVVERLCNASADPTAGAAVGDLEAQPVIIAARAGHVGILDVLARAGARPLTRALCAACESGSAAAVDLLLSKRVAPEAEGVGSASPLLLAARGATTTSEAATLAWRGFDNDGRAAIEGAFRSQEQATRFGICQRLLAQHADASSADSDGQTPLHWAAATGDRQIVQLLLQLGCSPEPPGLRNCPLHVVCAALPHDSEAIIDMLIEHGARVDARDADGATPLLYCVRGFGPPVAPTARHAYWSPPIVPPEADSAEAVAEPIVEPEDSQLTAAEKYRFDFVKMLRLRGADVGRASPESCLHAIVRLSAAGAPYPPRKPWPILEQILRLRVNPDCRDDQGRSPLAVAISCGASDAIDLLLSSDYHLDLDTPLRAAAMTGDAGLAKLLLERKADANAGAGAEKRQAPLHLVAEQGFHQVQTLLLDAAADVNWLDVDGRTPLITVVTAGKLSDLVTHGAPDAAAATTEAVVSTDARTIDDSCLAKMAEELIYYGADVDIKFGSDSWTPLLLAAQAGRPAVLRALLKKRADASCTIPSTGASALHLVAGRQGSVPTDQMRELVSELVRQGCKVDMRDKRQQTAMHVAARAGWPDALKTLTTKGAEVALKDVDGRIPLHNIAESNTTREGAMQLMRWLVDPRTWDLDSIVDVDGRTPLHHAACLGQVDFALALLQKEANPDLRDKGGASPLHLAAGLPENAAVVLVAALLAARAKQYDRDGSGRSALDYANGVSTTGNVVKLLSPAS